MSSRLFCGAAEDLVTRSALVELGRDRRHIDTINKILARVRGFECENILDKFYGILALIDWNGKPIHPDYQKSTFHLALELLSDEEANFDGYLSITFRAAWLVENFRLDKSNWHIRERVEHLSSHITTPAVPVNNERRVCHRISGYGYPLVSKRHRILGYLPHRSYIRVPRNLLHRSLSHESLVYIPGDSGKEIYGPLLDSTEMKEGDWLIQVPVHRADIDLELSDRQQASDTYVFVAHPSSETHFELVGYTAAETLPEFYVGLEFHIYLDSEDLLMLAVHHNALQQLLKTSGGKIENKSLLELWSRRVCRFPGSSYAVSETARFDC